MGKIADYFVEHKSSIFVYFGLLFTAASILFLINPPPRYQDFYTAHNVIVLVFGISLLATGIFMKIKEK